MVATVEKGFVALDKQGLVDYYMSAQAHTYIIFLLVVACSTENPETLSQV